ncbi:hypothetical protein [Siminovitchia sp. FSL W7-1587]|uniref:hypothetical protein n=1 Tax=Siminovitchia sp. FSL W7-1587 TaxID=2954699 RepID=UPI0030CD1648
MQKAKPYIQFIITSLILYCISLLFMMIAIKIMIILFGSVNNTTLINIFIMLLFVLGYIVYHVLMNIFASQKNLRVVKSNLLTWLTVIAIFIAFYSIFIQVIHFDNIDVQRFLSHLLAFFLFPNIYLKLISNKLNSKFQHEKVDEVQKNKNMSWIKTWTILYLISLLVLIAGLVVIVLGAYKKEVALVVSGIGLVGSFVGMYASATNTKMQQEKDRPYIILRANEDRYGVLQLELYNVGNNTAIIKEVNLEKDPDIISEGTLKSNSIGMVIHGKGSVLFPYIVFNNENYSEKYIDIKGSIKYYDLSREIFSNQIRLNLKNIKQELANKKESIKRDYEIIKNIKYLKDISESLKNKKSE